ncbi:MAG: bis(5'-nucleosyl)-tetraphosphatase (symmetrical) [Gammaproteobacteria bacterium GWF2_41_13]|nr:MAG: bis(5'-nucleosyl)-tetraphosphatase (symmetrical) [Gammaproteobacteria bacterium GWF2_41_13]
MSTYAIGDVQGCCEELQLLLKLIEFDCKKDRLWFVGDLINRGPNSLQVLRFIRSLGDQQITVLGNHDLHCMAVAIDSSKGRPHDHFSDILKAPDKIELIDWLRNQKILHYDKSLNAVLVHAGIYPKWDLEEAIQCARELEAMLQSNQYAIELKNMYGDQSEQWNPALTGIARYRFFINAFTRMRYCYADGRLNLTEKGVLGSQSNDLYPWFSMPNRIPIQPRIIFGHWASLNGQTYTPNIEAIDTGCSWGHTLTALRLEDNKRFAVPAKQRYSYFPHKHKKR